MQSASFFILRLYIQDVFLPRHDVRIEKTVAASQ